MTYTVAYFIAKFEAIPEERWCVGSFYINYPSEQACALGHCGAHYEATWDPEAQELDSLFSYRDKDVLDINDGKDHRYPQPTPKQRILAALSDVKGAGSTGRFIA